VNTMWDVRWLMYDVQKMCGVRCLKCDVVNEKIITVLLESSPGEGLVPSPLGEGLG
jgi:hypothetical protein